MTEQVTIDATREGLIIATVEDAITDEHALSLAAHALTAVGYGDAELKGIGSRLIGEWGHETNVHYAID